MRQVCTNLSYRKGRPVEDSFHVFSEKLDDLRITELERQYRKQFETALEKLYGIHYSEHTLAKWWPSSNGNGKVIYTKEFSRAD